MPTDKNAKKCWKDNARLSFKGNKLIEVKKKGGKSKMTASGKRLMKAL